MTRAPRRTRSATALAAALLVAAAGSAACGKYGPPERPAPAQAPAETDPAESLDRGEFDDGDGASAPSSPEQAP